MTTGTRLEARENRLVARTTVATATRIVRLATSDRAGAVRFCGFGRSEGYLLLIDPTPGDRFQEPRH